MSPFDNVVALVPAAGGGQRLGLGPKAFLELGGETLLARTIRTLAQAAGRVLIAAPPDHIERARAEVIHQAEVFSGGSSRHESIRILLEHCVEDFVLIHDVTRPFASAALCRRVAKEASEHGAAGAFVPALVGAGRGVEGYVRTSVPSSELRIPQSPHCYRREILTRAYEVAAERGIAPQSNWELVLAMGVPIREVLGESNNIKITLPFDWDVARSVVFNQSLEVK